MALTAGVSQLVDRCRGYLVSLEDTDCPILVTREKINASFIRLASACSTEKEAEEILTRILNGIILGPNQIMLLYSLRDWEVANSRHYFQTVFSHRFHQKTFNYCSTTKLALLDKLNRIKDIYEEKSKGGFLQPHRGENGLQAIKAKFAAYLSQEIKALSDEPPDEIFQLVPVGVITMEDYVHELQEDWIFQQKEDLREKCYKAFNQTGFKHMLDDFVNTDWDNYVPLFVASWSKDISTVL